MQQATLRGVRLAVDGMIIMFATGEREIAVYFESRRSIHGHQANNSNLATIAHHPTTQRRARLGSTWLRAVIFESTHLDISLAGSGAQDAARFRTKADISAMAGDGTHDEGLEA